MLIKKPKIAILTIRNSYDYGGVLSSLRVVHEFCKDYFNPTVFFLGFTPDIATSIRGLKFRSSLKPISYFGMNCIEVGARWAFWEPGHYWFTEDVWEELLAEYDYFFVVSGTCIAAHPLVLLNKKFVMWIGTPYDDDRLERVKRLTGLRKLINTFAEFSMRKIEFNILQASRYTWAISAYAQRAFEHKLGHPHENLVHCSYPVDVAKYQDNITTPQQRDDIIIAVGRFSDPRKNIAMLLRVFDKIHARLPHMKLYITGMKPNPETLLPYLEQASFDNVVFTGQVSCEDLHNLYKRARLMLITSYQEGLGIVGLEAMMYGVPVIATDCGGTADYVINGQTGYLVAVNDDDAMVNHACHILTHPEIETALSIQARTLIQEQFSKKKVYEHFRQGLVATYPELVELFRHDTKETDHEYRGDQSHVHSTHQP